MTCQRKNVGEEMKKAKYMRPDETFTQTNGRILIEFIQRVAKFKGQTAHQNWLGFLARTSTR